MCLIVGLCIGTVTTRLVSKLADWGSCISDPTVGARLEHVCLLADREAEIAEISAGSSDAEASKAGRYELFALQGIRQTCHETDGIVVRPQVRFTGPSN